MEMCDFQNEKIDKEKDNKDTEGKDILEEKRFDPSGYDHDLVEMLGTLKLQFFINII